MPRLHLSSIRIFRRDFKAPQLTLMCSPVVFSTSAKPFSRYPLYPVLSTHTLPLLCPIKSYPPFRLDASPPSEKTSPALNTGNILSDPVSTACPLPDSLSCVSSGVYIPWSRWCLLYFFIHLRQVRTNVTSTLFWLWDGHLRKLSK